MSETQVLLSKILALRQRLEQAQGLANEARSAAASLLRNQGLGALAEQVAAGMEQSAELDAAVGGGAGDAELRNGPRQLSSRARRVLERGSDLLLKLRDLADDFAAEAVDSGPLAPFYQSTASMIDTTLRTISLFPDSIAGQLQLCRGLEETLEVVGERLRTLSENRTRRRHEHDLVIHLADLVGALSAGRAVELGHFLRVVEDIQAEAVAGEPLRFLEGDPYRPAVFVACHGLTVARVAARVTLHGSYLKERRADLILAGLLHDVGMAALPPDILAHAGPLTGEQRRQVERHCRRGAEFLIRLAPDRRWLADAAEHHHERLDGTGYPDGLRDHAQEPLVRLLAVCDVYSALCSGRAYRTARSSRTALADTLLLAEKGLLDAHCAEQLLTLTFYPVGSMVELAHGERGVVVATAPPGVSVDAPSRPVVALLTDPQGHALPRVRHVDLTRSEHRIVRSLSVEERRDMSRRFPQWV